MTKAEKEKLKKVERLIQAVDKIYPSNKELIWKNFVRGVFIGLGATIGASIIIAALTFTLDKLKLIPVIEQIIIQTNVEEVLPEDR